MGRLIFITGGARSGKSKFAEDLTLDLALQRDPNLNKGCVTYLATCVPSDREMRERVKMHKDRRPSYWETVEEPREVARTIREKGYGTEVLLVDCLGLYVTNLLLEDEEETLSQEKGNLILSSVREVAEAARKVPSDVVVVSNEVGMGLVPEYLLGRVFRDVLGWANQILADASDEVYFMVSGVPMRVKPQR